MIVIIITRQWQKQYLLINKVLLLSFFLLFNDECSDHSDYWSPDQKHDQVYSLVKIKE